MYLVYVVRDFKKDCKDYKIQLIASFSCFYSALCYLQKMKELYKNNIYYIKENKYDKS